MNPPEVLQMVINNILNTLEAFSVAYHRRSWTKNTATPLQTATQISHLHCLKSTTWCWFVVGDNLTGALHVL